MNRWLPWKILCLTSILFLFFMLFNVLYVDLMRLPESGFSRGLPLIEYEVSGAFEDYYAKNAFVLPGRDDFHFVFSDLSTVQMIRFSKSGEQMDSTQIKLDHPVLEMNGQISDDGQILQLFFFEKGTSVLFEQSFSTATGEAVTTAREIADHPRSFFLGSDHLIYATGEAVYLYFDETRVKISDALFVDTLTSYHAGDLLYVTFTTLDQASYNQMLITLDHNFQIIDTKSLHQFVGGSSTLPSEIALFIDQNHYYTTSVFKDKKGGTNYIYLMDASLSLAEPLEINKFTASNYSIFPTYYQNKDQIMIAISFPTTIGRVDMDTAGGKFTNLVTSPISDLTFKALTKTIRPSVKPLFFTLDSEPSEIQYPYLISTEISKNNSTAYLSSTDPKLIEKSLKIKSSEIIDLLMTTITTFLPLSYVGLILEVYILVPIMMLVLIASMFYINWAERNGNKLLLASIGIHIIAKFFFVYTKILNQPDKFSHFPEFLDHPFKLFGWGLIFTGVSLLCYMDYRKKHKDIHYMKSYLFFNVVDLIFFVMLYTPYLFLS